MRRRRSYPPLSRCAARNRSGNALPVVQASDIEGNALQPGESGWHAIACRILSDYADAETGRPHESIPDSAWDRLRAMKIDGLFRAADPRSGLLQSAYARIEAMQQASAAEAVQALLARDVTPLAFKGIDLTPRYFADGSPSAMNDIDLLVKRDEIGRARTALLGLGFRQAYFDETRGALVDADIADIADVERMHYELYPFRRILPIDFEPAVAAELRASPAKQPLVFDDEGGAWLVDEIDLHHSVALDVDPQPLFARARRSVVPGALALDAADHLWLITSRCYNEVALHGKRSLRDFAYIVGILRHESVDWSRVLAVASEYEMRPALYYYLRFADSLFSNRVVDPEVWSRLDPRQGSRARDWGWQLACLFDTLDAFPEWAKRPGGGHPPACP